MADLNKLPQGSAGCFPAGVTDAHGKDAFEVRFGTATAQATKTGSVSHPTNGDEKLADKSATYTKCLKQAGYGIVDSAAFALFKAALASGDPSDFEKSGLLGGARPLNGPLGAFALTLAGVDSRGFGTPTVPPPPKVSGKEYATELVELYWASLLRDVPFTEYETNATAIAAADELTKLKAHYAGPLAGGKVTPHLLFRGGFTDPARYFAGEQFGPYVSQFCIHPTALGAQKIDQKMQTYAAGVDYMIDLNEWQNVQSGISTSATTAGNMPDPQGRYMHNGRALGAFTHQDELYQAYFVAYLTLHTLGIAPNPTSPYAPGTGFKQQAAFGTFGGPDIAATLGAVARLAINTVWYQKWLVHLRHRPESGGGLVHLKKTGLGVTDAQVDPIVLNSAAVQLSGSRNGGSFLLSQAFPEGSPAHPAYPTGHGAVAGACITVLKFFFDGGAPIVNPLVPSSDGLTLLPYSGADTGQMTVNGELHKLAHNVSFGHGIHPGIHWRSDTDYSIILGEAAALKFLQDQVFTYDENIDIKLTKLDGTSITISNH